MRTSIYLSNRSIAAVCDSQGAGINISRFQRAELPRGLVSNGTVTDPVGLQPYIESFMGGLGGSPGRVTLVIDGDTLTGKVLDVPGLSPKHMRGLIRNELSIGRERDFIHDYSVISRRPDGGGRIFAVAAERESIAQFAALFAGCGLTLRGIDVSQACAMRFFGEVPEYTGKTFICAFADGPDIILMLFVDGEFSFVDRSQLAEPRGTPAAAVEISRVLSSMMQYAYSSSGKNPLKSAFISGLVGEESHFYGEIGDALGLAVGPLAGTKAVSFAQSAPGDWGPYLFCLGDLMG